MRVEILVSAGICYLLAWLCMACALCYLKQIPFFADLCKLFGWEPSSEKPSTFRVIWACMQFYVACSLAVGFAEVCGMLLHKL